MTFCRKKKTVPSRELLLETLENMAVFLGTGMCSDEGCEVDKQQVLQAAACALRGHSYVAHWKPIKMKLKFNRQGVV